MWQIMFERYYYGQNQVEGFFPFFDYEKDFKLAGSSLRSAETKLTVHPRIFNEDNVVHREYLNQLVDQRERFWLVTVWGGKAFFRYFLQNGWVVSDVNYVEDIRGVILFIKDN